MTARNPHGILCVSLGPAAEWLPAQPPPEPAAVFQAPSLGVSLLREPVMVAHRACLPQLAHSPICTLADLTALHLSDMLVVSLSLSPVFWPETLGPSTPSQREPSPTLMQRV